MVYSWVNMTVTGLILFPTWYVAYHYSLVFSCLSLVILASVNLAMIYYLGGEQQMQIIKWSNFWGVHAAFLLMVFGVQYLNGLRRKLSEELIEKDLLQVQLKIQIQAAQEANQHKDHLFLAISHDLRAPINAIIELSELIKHEHNRTKKDNYCNIIHHSANGFLDSINDLLSTEQQAIDTRSVHFDARHLVDAIVELFAPLYTKKTLSLQVIYANEIPRFYGQEKMVRQILFNLLDNSLKYTVFGGVEIRINTVTIDQASEILKISVADTGIGMSDYQRQRVTHQITSKNKADIKGSGLGLDHCLWMLNKLSGTIAIESEKGEGCTCIVSIPLMLDGGAHKLQLDTISLNPKQVRTPLLQDKKIGEKKILLVEDQTDYAQTCIQKINLLGQPCAWANTAKLAMTMYSATPYDLVLLDMNLPDMSSEDLFINIAGDKSSSLFPPIAIISADVQGKRVLKWMREGANLILNKPIALEELDELLLLLESHQNACSVQHNVQIDNDFLNKEIELLGIEKVRELIDLFYNSSETSLENICESFAMRKFPECTRHLHKYISALSNLGLLQLAELTKYAESQCDKGQRITLSFTLYHLVCGSQNVQLQLAGFLQERS